MVMVTDRQTQLRQLADAGSELPKCWQGFLDAANELTQVAGQSKVSVPPSVELLVLWNWLQRSKAA